MSSLVQKQVRPLAWLGVLMLAAVLLILVVRSAPQQAALQAQVHLLPLQEESAGFARALTQRTWSFPKDHGLHPEYQTEWWYYTGNVSTASGRRFGFQFTIFRRALTPQPVDSRSEWRTTQLYMAHFTITDVAARKFYQAERFSRGSLDLAGATTEPVYRVWLEDWSATALSADARIVRIQAREGNLQLDLTLEQAKPPVLQGDNGLSQKGDEPGNATYYYSLTRLNTTGSITIGGETFDVAGTSWMDHEFGTSSLGENAVGWDWFGLHLDDGRDLMLGRIRLADGGFEPMFGGILVLPDGTTRPLHALDFTVQATATWKSPHTGAVYPAGWQITINTGDALPLQLKLTPLLSDQELTGSISYWEGAVRIGGDASGYGYAELTGYATRMTGRV
jgi:predicted secreted hydrolase